MNSQTLLLVNNQDKFIGYDSYEVCHTGRGKRHRAFVTLLFDKDNNVLLQKRKHRLFDGLWDLTAISHPLHINGEDESFQEASNRALKKEMGIDIVSIENVGSFNYFAKDGGNCENEHCSILIGIYNGKIKPNKKEVYETRRVSFEDFINDIENNSRAYTPWAILTARILKQQQSYVFKCEHSKFQSIYESYATAFYVRKYKEAGKYSKIILELYKNLQIFSLGGKMLRAFFVYLGYLAGGGSGVDKILPISLAFEMTQNFFLIHDDFMDNSDLRRGKRTIHKIYEEKHGKHYGASMAVDLGDIAAIEALRIISSSDFTDQQKAVCLEEFSKILLETAFGQALDIEYSYEEANIEKIYKINTLKTAKYSIVGPLSIGASLAGASNVQKSALVNFGQNAGLAFQLQDDILGLFGNEETIGKSVLSDMREGKNTVLIYKARELVSEADRAKLDKIWGDANAADRDLNIIREIVRNSGALDWCNTENRKLVVKAKREISKITKDRRLQIIFEQIADYIVSRES